MDYKELSKRMRKRYLDNLNGLLQKPDDVFSDCNKAATAITDLLARAEAAEQKATELDNALSNASKVVKTMQESTIPYYRKRVELAEKEVEWKNKVIEAAERRFIEAEAENEKLKNCRNQCKIVCLLEKYNEMEEKMIKEKERAEKAERKLNSLLDEEETVAFDPFGVQKED